MVSLFCGKLELTEADIAAVRQKVGRHTKQLPAGCVVWTRSVDAYGYGQFWITNWRGERDIVKAHRAAYELANGAIPEGLTIDHVCENKACVNPAHMEPVAAEINSKRYAARRAARRATCSNGHVWDASQRRCVECSRVYDRRRRADPARNGRRLKAKRERYARNPEPQKAASRAYYRRQQCS